MLVLKSILEPKAVHSRVRELLELSKDPADLARVLLIAEEADRVERGVRLSQLRELGQQLERLVEIDRVEAAMVEARNPTGLRKLLKKGPDFEKIEKLQERRKTLGDEWQALSWYYRNDRVWLAACVRDMAFDAGLLPDAVWIEISDEADYAPTAHLFRKRLLAEGRVLMEGLSGKFNEIDPDFLLTSVDGHKSLHYDPEEKTLTYLKAVKG